MKTDIVSQRYSWLDNPVQGLDREHAHHVIFILIRKYCHALLSITEKIRLHDDPNIFTTAPWSRHVNWLLFPVRGNRSVIVKSIYFQ